MKINLLIFLLFFYIIITTGCPNNQTDFYSKKNLFKLTIGNKELFVEIADTPKKREMGLMFREKMPYDVGMLFVFEEESDLSFWMKNTRIPLSIAFIKANGDIINIIDMQPFDQRSHKSAQKAKFALEVNQGWFDKNGIVEGDKIELGFLNTKLK